ncbi:MAG TPA: formylglycine-generating enzyme family protein, partial [Nitrosomonas sp.]|nr:formylglycine-generating enzyme family protein [Nitrosomonas sp.]
YRWSGSARLLIDINSHIFPLRHDLIFLHNKLTRLRGTYGLHIQYLNDQPGEQVYYWDKEKTVVEQWVPPDRGMPFLITSDLGMLSRSKRVLNNWLVFGRKLAMKGCRPTVLMPVPVRLIDIRLLDYFDCVSWDSNSRLKQLLSINPDSASIENHQSKINQLLSRLAPAVRINPVLLREARFQANEGDFDIGHEAAVWHHPSVQLHGDELTWRPIDHEFFLQAFTVLPASMQQRMIDLIARSHSQLPEVLYFEAMLNCMHLAFEHIDPTVREATERYMAALTRTSQEHPDFQGLKRWEGRFLGRQKADVLRKNNKIVGAIEGIRLQRNAEIGQEIVVPPGIDQNLIIPFLGHQEKKRLSLHQKGRELILSPEGSYGDSAAQQGFSDSGSLLTHILTSNNFILKESLTEQGQSAAHILKFNPEQSITIALTGTRRYELKTDWESVVIEPLSKPDWALSIVNDPSGLSAESKDNQGNVYRYYWYPLEWQSKIGRLPGFWFYLPASASTLKPDWAIAAGRDPYGLYADIEIYWATQRFRWIEPTSFMMGSPEDEAGRFDDERLHRVILTQGYWLADTACTQALWHAVMRKNPSRFRGEQLPVENVSWEDVQHFLKKLNELNPELKLRLPTEAEWENACRAGTTSAFNFGGDITLDKVNYRGTWDDLHSWGEGALQQTATVRSYPPNAWGLYEMHGNVWEWCQDSYGKYPSEPVIDPQGSEAGASRVLRGGAWLYYARRVRSATRDGSGPGLRDGYIGFRLARGHGREPVRTVRAGQQPADRSATAAGEGWPAGWRKPKRIV